MSSNPGILQLFYVSTDNDVWTRWRNPDGSWSDEQNLGGVLNGYPVAAQLPGIDVLQLFYRGADYGVWSRWRNPDGSWSDEQSIGGVVNGDPIAALLPGTNVIQLFYRGSDNGVWTRWRNTDGSWSDEQNLASSTVPPPSLRRKYRARMFSSSFPGARTTRVDSLAEPRRKLVR